MARLTVTMPEPDKQHLKNFKMRWVDETYEVIDPVTKKKIIETRPIKEKVPKSVKDGVTFYEMGGEPDWIICCPSDRRCGRSWTFIPDKMNGDNIGDASANFKPKDTFAYAPETSNLVIPEGYVLEIAFKDNLLLSLIQDDKGRPVVYDEKKKKWLDWKGKQVLITIETKQGYLNYRKVDLSGKVLFECDRCGQEIELVK